MLFLLLFLPRSNPCSVAYWVALGESGTDSCSASDISQLQDPKANYAGSLDVIKKVMASSGPLGLYRGMEATFWRCALLPFATVILLCGLF